LTRNRIAEIDYAGLLGGTWRFKRGDLDQWIASGIGKVTVDDNEGVE